MGDVNNINMLHSKEILPNDSISIHPVLGLFCTKRPCLGGRCSKEVEGGLFTQFRVWSAPNDPIGIVDAARRSRGIIFLFWGPLCAKGLCFVRGRSKRVEGGYPDCFRSCSMCEMASRSSWTQTEGKGALFMPFRVWFMRKTPFGL